MNPFELAMASAAWGLASALALLLLSVFAGLGGAARPRGALPFSLFGTLLGAQVAVASLTKIIADPGLAATLHLVSLALLLPLPYLLTEFAVSQLPHRAPYARSLRAASLLPAALAAVLLLLRPGLLFQGVAAGPLVPHPQWTILYGFLVVLPYFFALSGTLYALHAAHRDSPSPRTALRRGILFAGMGIFVGYTGGNNLAFYIVGAFYYPLHVTEWIYAGLFVGMTLVTVALGIQRVQAAMRRPLWEEARREWLIAAALLFPAGWGALEGGLAATVLPYLDTIGLWRTLAIGTVAYGLARWRTHDLPERAKHAVATAGGVAAAVAGGATAWGMASLSTSGPAAPWVFAILVGGAALLPSVGTARRLILRSRATTRVPVEDVSYGKRLDAYRAAVESSIANATWEEDEEFLEALRERLNLEPAEARVLSFYARTTVIQARVQSVDKTYDRLRLLGEGGCGRTYLARDRATDRLVVLKEPLETWHRDGDLQSAVLREARLAMKVRHPNVVAVHDVLEDKGRVVIIMEYVSGGSLADLLSARGALSPQAAIPLAIELLHGLNAIHHAGILHRDLKPSNILLTSDGSPKIADFGIAIDRSKKSGTAVLAPLWLADTTEGTPRFMAPEALRGAPDARSDIFSVGVLLRDCLDATSTMDERLGAIIDSAVQVEPTSRPQTAIELAAQLEAWLKTRRTQPGVASP